MNTRNLINLEAFRIARRSRSDRTNLLSGEGAAQVSGRWNSKGTRIIYTASSRSLAILEVLVHLAPPLIPSDYVLVRLPFPDELVEKRNPIAEILKEGFNLAEGENELRETREVGDNWVASSNSAVLQVPSFVVRGESNYLINPAIAENVVLEEVVENPFDRRLFKNLENLIVDMQDLQERFGSLVRETEDLLRRYRTI